MVDTTHELVRLTADVVVLAGPASDRRVLLIKRGWPPFQGMWALPGGHVDPGETTLAAAARELAEETGVTVDNPRWDLVEVATYSTPNRDPRGRYVSVAYRALLPEPVDLTAGDDAREAAWFPITDVLNGQNRRDGARRTVLPLAFDHIRILVDAEIGTCCMNEEG
jgi:8-oxo-dGTP diphosphatase